MSNVTNGNTIRQVYYNGMKITSAFNGQATNFQCRFREEGWSSASFEGQ